MPGSEWFRDAWRAHRSAAITRRRDKMTSSQAPLSSRATVNASGWTTVTHPEKPRGLASETWTRRPGVGSALVVTPGNIAAVIMSPSRIGTSLWPIRIACRVTYVVSAAANHRVPPPAVSAYPLAAIGWTNAGSWPERSALVAASIQ
jgi:hypothetical protein